jgi:hypothetical protein
VSTLAARKSCDRCADTEWPCFLVQGLCRMCQAWKRDQDRVSVAATECGDCGEVHPPADCAWAKQCGECLRSGIQMEGPRLCTDCAEDIEAGKRLTAREKARHDYEARGDYLRDMRKGEPA